MASETDTTANIYTCSLFFFSIIIFFLLLFYKISLKYKIILIILDTKNTTDMPGSRTSKDDEKDFIMV